MRAVVLSAAVAGSILGTALPAQTAAAGQDTFIAGPSYPALPVQTALARGMHGTPPRAARDEAADFERQAEALIAAGINEARDRYAEDAPKLAANAVLTDIAQARSRAMAEGAAEFSHTDAQGRFIAADMVQARFGPYGAIGENILKLGSTRRFDAQDFARQAVEGWLQSPGHRKNILDPEYNASGIGVALIGGTAYATQVFWGPPRRDD